MPDPNHDLVRKNIRTGLIVLVAVAIMAGLSFASVPLYRLFCQATGFDGTTVVSETLPGIVLDRTVTIKFNADTGLNMPWEFRPEMPEIKVHLGQKGLISFFAHNRLDKVTAGTALYNVTPPKAGRYFHKIQCFCFDKQVLEPGQKADLPVVFYVDPSMNDDPNMADVNTISLSYTFFEADSKELDAALEKFYNGGAPDKQGTP